MRLNHFLYGLALLLAFSWKIPRAHACKPCPSDSLQTSIQQASLVLDGTVESIKSSDPKASSGRARITVRVKQWLFRTSEHQGLASPGNLQTLELGWGSPCLPHPSIPKEKSRNVFFIAQLSKIDTVNLGILTGYCSVPFLEVNQGQIQTSGEKPLSLRKLQRKIQTAKFSKS